MRMHKAISIIQFKAEGQASRRNPQFHLEHRDLLHKIDYQNGTIELDGKIYELLDKNFPTIDPKDPYQLSNEEEEIMERLEQAFRNCGKLQDHMRFLLNKGSLYKVYNKNLLYHGCVPLMEDGQLKEANIFGEKRKGAGAVPDLGRICAERFLRGRCGPAAAGTGHDVVYLAGTGFSFVWQRQDGYI